MQTSVRNDLLPAKRRPVPRLALGVAVVVVVQFLLIMVYAWSSSRAAPHRVPIAIAGPVAADQGVIRGLEHAQPGTFRVIVVADARQARSFVTGRKVYGALSLSPGGATVYTASEASPAVAQMLSRALPAAIAHVSPRQSVAVIDLAPNPTRDPNGTGIPTALIPLTITSLVVGTVIGLLARRRRSRLLALIAYALLAGLLATTALHTALGVLTGSFVGSALVLALGAGAIAAVTAGAVAVAGVRAIGACVLVMFFVGFAFSGTTTAWQFVPTPWGHLAQYLPVGATNTSLRSVAFFKGARDASSLAVLIVWVLAGVALALLRGDPHRTKTTPRTSSDPVYAGGGRSPRLSASPSGEALVGSRSVSSPIDSRL